MTTSDSVELTPLCMPSTQVVQLFCHISSKELCIRCKLGSRLLPSIEAYKFSSYSFNDIFYICTECIQGRLQPVSSQVLPAQSKINAEKSYIFILLHGKCAGVRLTIQEWRQNNLFYVPGSIPMDISEWQWLEQPEIDPSENILGGTTFQSDPEQEDFNRDLCRSVSLRFPQVNITINDRFLSNWIWFVEWSITQTLIKIRRPDATLSILRRYIDDLVRVEPMHIKTIEPFLNAVMPQHNLNPIVVSTSQIANNNNSASTSLQGSMNVGQRALLTTEHTPNRRTNRSPPKLRVPSRQGAQGPRPLINSVETTTSYQLATVPALVSWPSSPALHNQTDQLPPLQLPSQDYRTTRTPSRPVSPPLNSRPSSPGLHIQTDELDHLLPLRSITSLPSSPLPTHDPQMHSSYVFATLNPLSPLHVSPGYEMITMNETSSSNQHFTLPTPQEYQQATNSLDGLLDYPLVLS